MAPIIITEGVRIFINNLDSNRGLNKFIEFGRASRIAPFKIAIHQSMVMTTVQSLGHVF